MAAQLEVFWHAAALEHDTGSGLWEAASTDLLAVPELHPENADRIRNMVSVLERGPIASRLDWKEGRLAEPTELESVHEREYVESIRAACEAGGKRFGSTTVLSASSWEPVLAAAGTTIAAADAVAAQESEIAYALVRPPGHHAGPAVADGYCFFNNVALAAERFRAAGAERVAIVDWDVHHGNSTQACFYDRADVLTISVHMRHGSWGQSHPETGAPDESGTGAGAGYNVNVELRPGSGDGAYAEAFSRVVEPVLARYEPEALIGACGQDASAFDGNGRMNVTMGGFHAIGASMRACAQKADARLLLVQEGGYARTYAAYCLHATLEGVLGTGQLLDDPLAYMPDDAAHASADIDAVCAQHRAWGALVSAELPFANAEYRHRAHRVREEMAARDVDVLFVMSPANLCYLTGFESIWYPPRAPLGVVVSRHDERLVFLDYERHETLVREIAFFDDAVFYRYDDALDSITAAFRDRGWADGSVGIEWWTQTPGAPLVRETADRLAAIGAKVVAGDWIVDRVRALKSEAELVFVRRAAEIVDAAFADLLETARPGRTELQIAARLDAAMADEGGESAAIRTMVSAGPDVWCRTHSPPSRRPLEVGDVMYVDACGVFNRYHADLCRTVAIGRDHPDAREILAHTAGSVDAVRKAVRRGDPLDVAQRAAEEWVYAKIPREQVWWVGGYALGIAVPPNWVGHTYLSNDAFETFTWERGYVTNYENIVFDRDRGFTASYMETLVMTDAGVEPLSRHGRELVVVC